MQRWFTVLVGVAVVGLAVWMVARDFHAPVATGHDAPADGGAKGGDVPLAYAEAGGPSEASEALVFSDLAPPEPRGTDGGIGAAWPDGTPVPALPMSAPREVRFGVVLVSYAGAQPSAGGGRTSTRSRAEAKELATKLVVTAQHDFHAAVQQGDAGSSEDVGTVRWAILEPAPEYVLFTLPVDGVGGPVDTPRGYWIVKRLE
jgi:hypothetical protein